MRGWEKLKSYGEREVLSRKNGINAVAYRIHIKDSSLKSRIVFLSDLHMDETSSPLSEIAEFINCFCPDFIIFGGDVASMSSALEDAFAFLKTLRAKEAKFSVLGNWDMKKSRCKNMSYWLAEYHKSGFSLLCDSSKLLGKILFHGFPMSRGVGISGELPFPKEYCKIMIAHSPDDIVTYKHRFELAFSGHTHAGQIRFPLIGSLKTSSKYWKNFDYGLFQRDDGSKLIVSSGIGTSCLPIRMLCEPEIVVVDI
ncbi:MAG TPA: metallophosphoesterase [Victivallales bacterium]|nr:metallophosphoesterase [Victivallales bacterium]